VVGDTESFLTVSYGSFHEGFDLRCAIKDAVLCVAVNNEDE
jgi:hypothetical protein